jgi:peptide/nickel transport system permease protein
VPLGLAAGYFGGWLDEVLMRLMDALLVFPAVLLALVVIAVLGPGLIPMSIAIAIVFVPAFARLTRGSVLAVKPREYVEASRALGASTVRVIGRHVLPNVAAPIIVQISISLAYAILIEAALSYLGFGTQPPTPSWGQMLNEARSHMGRAPWLAIFPGVAIGLTVAALNLLGDRLRDILDPHVAP